MCMCIYARVFMCVYVRIYVRHYFSTEWCTKLIFLNRKKNCLNSKIYFFDWLPTKTQENHFSYNLHMALWGRDRFIPFPRALSRTKVSTGLSRFWTSSRFYFFNNCYSIRVFIHTRTHKKHTHTHTHTHIYIYIYIYIYFKSTNTLR